jgi:hypothetical protein
LKDQTDRVIYKGGKETLFILVYFVYLVGYNKRKEVEVNDW